jgi:hypothetical protein
MGAVRMRNAKPAAKESRLYDYALIAISGARSYSTGSVEGSREVRRSQKTTIALPNIRGIPQWGCQSRKDRHPIEEFEEIVFEKLLTSSPNPRRNEP